MKKIFAIATIGALALSCTKKNDHALQDSNTMLEEPATPAIAADTTKKASDKTAVATPTEPAATPSTAPAPDHASGNTNAANSTGSSGGTPNGAEQKGSPAAHPEKK